MIVRTLPTKLCNLPKKTFSLEDVQLGLVLFHLIYGWTSTERLRPRPPHGTISFKDMVKKFTAFGQASVPQLLERLKNFIIYLSRRYTLIITGMESYVFGIGDLRWVIYIHDYLNSFLWHCA